MLFVCVLYSTPKSYLPQTSSPLPVSQQPIPQTVSQQPIPQTTQAVTLTEPRKSGVETSPVSTAGLASYEFISNPAKKAFFESPPSPAKAAAVDGERQPVFAKSDVDINQEAKINEYVAR